ncbi:hypothetical protein KC909_04125 [Candidatus Dojkabacteria bacterium]|uniref:Uncharacterized protein n=1 Tax=Candidatus Dojkabacteria bacterium TaxID=2099670 RepID=A0A955L6G4_9BACT|nr:hypothetical protein [Candidatus Dojkabacteria bacterium]
MIDQYRDIPGFNSLVANFDREADAGLGFVSAGQREASHHLAGILAHKLHTGSGGIVQLQEAVGGAGKTTLLNAIEPVLQARQILRIPDEEVDPYAWLAASPSGIAVATGRFFGVNLPATELITVRGFTNDEVQYLLTGTQGAELLNGDALADVANWSLGSMRLAGDSVGLLARSPELLTDERLRVATLETMAAEFLIQRIPQSLLSSWAGIKDVFARVREFIPLGSGIGIDGVASKMYELSEPLQRLNSVWDSVVSRYPIRTDQQTYGIYKEMVMRENSRPSNNPYREPRMILAANIPAELERELAEHIYGVIFAEFNYSMRKTGLAIVENNDAMQQAVDAPKDDYETRFRLYERAELMSLPLTYSEPRYLGGDHVSAVERQLEYYQGMHRLLAISGDHNKIPDTSMKFMLLLEAELQARGIEYSIQLIDKMYAYSPGEEEIFELV